EKFKRGSYPVIYDPEGHLDDMLSMTGLPAPQTLYVQAIEALHPKASLISNITKDKPSSLLILSFEPEKHLAHMGHLIPQGCKVESLAELRLPQEMISNSKEYLSDLNFSTNYALFREKDGWHTRLKSANCWAKYSAQPFKLW
ncbi:MAG: hypothetical protein ACYDBV_15450, partial [Nitrospiria bacterium]